MLTQSILAFYPINRVRYLFRNYFNLATSDCVLLMGEKAKVNWVSIIYQFYDGLDFNLSASDVFYKNGDSVCTAALKS